MRGGRSGRAAQSHATSPHLRRNAVPRCAPSPCATRGGVQSGRAPVAYKRPPSPGKQSEGPWLPPNRCMLPHLHSRQDGAMDIPSTPVLYCHRDSGYSYKVALALSLLGIGFEKRHNEIWKPRNERSPEFQAISAHGEVPVLLMDGHALCQSNAILDYL